VNHYGMVLNANRTYYLSRSHPPVLSMMMRDIDAARPDREWLAKSLPLLEKFYYYWRVPPHLNQATGLSRYHDMGSGPSPEVEFSERDENGLSHYDRVKEFLRTNEVQSYDKSLYYDAETDTLTPLAFKGDRSMRESGFDPTDRFGAMNLDVIHYAPVCLNVLLYQMEQDIAGFYEILEDASTALIWKNRAAETAGLINQYFWNEEAGLYFDYHLGDSRQREYPFLTTFWPLWAGVATERQAKRVAENIHIFLAGGGLKTSTRVTGEQWDAPFAWAPLQLFAVDGLERYGYHSEAREIARRYTAMVASEFEIEGVLREKYDAERCSSGVESQIHFGYSSNEIGFGWTNAVILEFLDRFR
jgi:alpha,alpha-trehalase